jgi:hypothetical protein
MPGQGFYYAILSYRTTAANLKTEPAGSHSPPCHSDSRMLAVDDVAEFGSGYCGGLPEIMRIFLCCGFFTRLGLAEVTGSKAWSSIEIACSLWIPSIIPLEAPRGASSCDARPRSLIFYCALQNSCQ